MTGDQSLFAEAIEPSFNTLKLFGNIWHVTPRFIFARAMDDHGSPSHLYNYLVSRSFTTPSNLKTSIKVINS